MPRTSKEEDGCPQCGSDELHFGTFEIDNTNTGFYPYRCNHCEDTGKMWYNLQYDVTISDNDDSDDESKDVK